MDEVQTVNPVRPKRLARLLPIAIWSSLILSVFLIYAQSADFDFINFDDPFYVYRNAHVQAGLTFDSIRWAFSSQTLGNWVPVTMLSHIVTSQLFGTDGGMHHVVNGLLHLFAAALLLMFLQRATGQRLASAFVALLFAVHPLHVESVVWIAERKDVLSAVFFFLSLYWYVRYAERPSLGRYLLVLVSFGLGLMSKPMLVTFPFLLLLLDVWPLNRLRWPQAVWEKLPLILFSATQAAGTYWIQKVTGSVQSLPLSVRVSNALLSYLIYIRDSFWPHGLAVFYPYPNAFVVWKVAVSGAILLAVSVAVFVGWRTRPYLAVGWFWYLGMLVPVVGFVQTGSQAHADRYMYLPQVGLSIMLAWGAADVVRVWPKTKPLLVAAAALTVMALTAVAWQQTTYWQNSETLYTHALDVTQDNWLALGNLGEHLSRSPDRRGDAIAHLEAAIRIRPNYPEAQNNLGFFLAGAGLCDAATPHFEATLREVPNDPSANLNLGTCLLNAARYEEAARYLQTAVTRTPLDRAARYNLGMALENIPGRQAEAIPHLEAALKSNPAWADAQHRLAEVLLKLGRTEEAIPHLEAEQSVHPNTELAKRLAALRSSKRNPGEP